MDKANYLPTGIYDGTLAEDFIETIKNEKRPFIKVKIDAFFKNYDEYPLCFVPVNFMIYPLKKDDKVKIHYPHGVNDVNYPVLYAVDFDMPKEILDNIDFPDKDKLVEFPSVEDTVSFNYYGENHYQIYTDKYMVQKYKDSMIIISGDKIFQYSTDSINLRTKDYRLEVSGKYIVQVGDDSTGVRFVIDSTANKISMVQGLMEITLNGVSHKIKVTNGMVNLKQVIDSAFDEMKGLKTVGSPVIHVVIGTSQATIMAAKEIADTLLE
jgi:hypothetical protein